MLMLAGIVFLLLRQLRRPRQAASGVVPTDVLRTILAEKVLFYQQLAPAQKDSFEKRVLHFLSRVRITGVNTEVSDTDRVLAGASAIIPIFAFPGWEYTNIREILLYPETFNEAFEQQGADRAILGMVGNGPMQQVMILSKQALENGFSNKHDKHNTAIHEFVHLIDKADGATDGIPEILMQHQYTLPWVTMIHKNIREIRENRSDIDPYGATNQAEFLAVAAEYFFERPDLLKARHPELFDMLEKIFRPQSPAAE